MNRVIVPVALVAALFARQAYADSARGLTMPNLSAVSTTGTDIQFAQFNAPDGKVTAVTLDVVTELAMKKQVVIGFRVPLSFVQAPGVPVFNPLCCGFQNGNLGFFSRVHFNKGPWRVGLDGGFSLSTAPDGDLDALDGGDSAASTHLTHDPSRYLPDSGTARLGASTLLRAARFFLQTEAALLVVQSTPGFGEQDDTLVKLDGAMGLRLFYSVTLVAGVNTTWTAAQNGAADDWLHSVEGGLRFTAGNVDVGMRFYYPLDQVLRDLKMIGGGLELGVRL
ncbi:MAG: hypothetical protein EXR73_11880 [Myxococcales bacterium]|nr:hypothetical protein [Myxococcales bacterium]